MKLTVLGMGAALLMTALPAGAEMRRPIDLPRDPMLAQEQAAPHLLPSRAEGKAAKPLIRVQSEAAPPQLIGGLAAVEIVGTSTDVLALAPVDVSVGLVGGEGAGFGLMLVMAEAPAQEFARMTTRYLGQVLEVYLCGELATSAVVMGQISSGTLWLFGNLPGPSAESLARRIKTGDCAGFTLQEMESLDGS